MSNTALKVEKSFDYSHDRNEWLPWVKVTFPAVPSNEHDSPVWKQRDELAAALASDRASPPEPPQSKEPVVHQAGAPNVACSAAVDEGSLSASVRAAADAHNLASLRRVMRGWHQQAIDLRYDGVADVLDAANPASPWIAVSERLPEKFTEVLIAFADCTLPATGQYTGNPNDTDGWCYPAENQGDGFDWTVTHWMPLPEAPKEQA